MDDRITGDRLRPEPLEGGQSLGLAGRDPPGEADLQRPRHRRRSALLGVALVGGLGLGSLLLLLGLCSLGFTLSGLRQLSALARSRGIRLRLLLARAIGFAINRRLLRFASGVG